MYTLKICNTQASLLTSSSEDNTVATMNQANHQSASFTGPSVEHTPYAGDLQCWIFNAKKQKTKKKKTLGIFRSIDNLVGIHDSRECKIVPLRNYSSYVIQI